MEISIKDIAIIDCEASGLDEKESYPIEVGIAMDEDSIDFLIKPVAIWNYWSKKSEKIHEIPRETLYNKGIDIVSAAELLNEKLVNKILFSDNSFYENLWINRLFDAAGISRNFEILSIYKISFDDIKFKQKRYQLSKLIPTHRALNDAYIIRESLLFAIS